MVIDSSAAVAILLGEKEQPDFFRVVARSAVRLMSAATLVEAHIVMLSRNGDAGAIELERLLSRFGFDIVPVDEAQARLAHGAFRKYGKGRHPAKLNFGDCFSYALAKWSGEPLLFKGRDFARTDVEPAFRSARDGS